MVQNASVAASLADASDSQQPDRASLVQTILAAEDVFRSLGLPLAVQDSLTIQDSGSYTLPHSFSYVIAETGWSAHVNATDPTTTSDNTLHWQWRASPSVMQSDPDLKDLPDTSSWPVEKSCALSIRLSLGTVRLVRSSAAVPAASQSKKPQKQSWECNVWIQSLEHEGKDDDATTRQEAPAALLSLWREALGLEAFCPRTTDTFQIRCTQLEWRHVHDTTSARTTSANIHPMIELTASSLHRQGPNLATVGKCSFVVGCFAMTGNYLQLALTHSVFVHWCNVSHLQWAGPSTSASTAATVWTLANPLKRVKVHVSDMHHNSDDIPMVKCQLPECTWKRRQVTESDANPTASLQQQDQALSSLLLEQLQFVLEMEKASFVWDEDVVLECQGLHATLEPITEKHKLVPNYTRSRMQVKAKQWSIPCVLEIQEVSMSSILETSHAISGQVTALHVMETTVQDMAVAGNSVSAEQLQAMLESVKTKDHWSRAIALSYAKVSSCTCYYDMENDMPRLVVGKNDETIPVYDSSVDSTLASLWTHYLGRFCRDIEIRNSRVSRTREAMGDTVAASLGRMALTGAAISTPIGLAASMAAVGVKDGVQSLAETGKSQREGGEASSYQFGDVTRGVVASVKRTFREKEDPSGDPNDDDQNNQEADGLNAADTDEAESKPSYMSRNKGRYAGLLGSSVGAVAGMAVLGPVGMIAGSFAASRAARDYAEGGSSGNIQEVETAHSSDDEDGTAEADFEPVHSVTTQSLPGTLVEDGVTVASRDISDSNANVDQRRDRAMPGETPPPFHADSDQAVNSGPENPRAPYKFGDGLKSVVARGKAADGRDKKSTYKFGDFTRGLFS